MTFDNNVPEWKNEGSDPPETLKEEGFTAGYKPPAAYFNWFFNRIQKSVKEIQDKLSKDLKAMAFKEDIGGEDISETVIKTMDTIGDKYPVPAAGESVKRFFGKVLTFLRNIKPLTGDISLYVATTGSDITGDGTSAKPFKTIQYAIDILPKDLGGHVARINVMNGIYPERLKIYGFSNGDFQLFSEASETISDACQITDIMTLYNTSYVTIGGFRITSTIYHGIMGYGNSAIRLQFLKIIDNALSYDGIFLSECKFSVWNCMVSYHNRALVAYNSHGVSNNWVAGTGNNYGLYSTYGSVISLIGTQPVATTSRVQDRSGSFSFENGTQITGLLTSGLSCTWGTIGGGYFRHGMYPTGHAMITIELYIVLTSNLTAYTQYTVNGFPACSNGVGIVVSSSPQGRVVDCYLTSSGMLRISFNQDLVLGSSQSFNCTYLTTS